MTDPRPLRILYSFPHPLGGAGIGTTAWQQVNALAGAGHRVTAMTSQCVRPWRHAPARYIPTFSVFGRRIPYKVVGVDRGWAIHDWLVAHHLRRHAADYDLVHAWPSAAERTLVAAREVGVPSFLHRPNTHPRFALDVVTALCKELGLSTAGRNMDAMPARLAHEEREFELADWLLCPSPFVAQTFIDRGYPPERFVPMRYGYDPERFRVVRRWSRGPLTAVFVGTIEPRKGLHVALRAWIESGAADAGGMFNIAGEVTAPEYAKLIERDLAHPSVRVHGFVPDVGRMMAECDVLVLPTYEESTAKVTYEARGCGCVLMVSDAAGAVVTHMQNGLVHAAGDQATLTGQFRQLLADPDLLMRLREASIAGVGDLTWQSAVADLAVQYRRCLDQASRRPRREAGAVSVTVVRSSGAGAAVHEGVAEPAGTEPASAPRDG